MFSAGGRLGNQTPPRSPAAFDNSAYSESPTCLAAELPHTLLLSCSYSYSYFYSLTLALTLNHQPVSAQLPHTLLLSCSYSYSYFYSLTLTLTLNHQPVSLQNFLTPCYDSRERGSMVRNAQGAKEAFG